MSSEFSPGAGDSAGAGGASAGAGAASVVGVGPKPVFTPMSREAILSTAGLTEAQVTDAKARRDEMDAAEKKALDDAFLTATKAYIGIPGLSVTRAEVHDTVRDFLLRGADPNVRLTSNPFLFDPEHLFFCLCLPTHSEEAFGACLVSIDFTCLYLFAAFGAALQGEDGAKVDCFFYQAAGKLVSNRARMRQRLHRSEDAAQEENSSRLVEQRVATDAQNQLKMLLDTGLVEPNHLLAEVFEGERSHLLKWLMETEAPFVMDVYNHPSFDPMGVDLEGVPAYQYLLCASPATPISLLFAWWRAIVADNRVDFSVAPTEGAAAGWNCLMAVSRSRLARERPEEAVKFALQMVARGARVDSRFNGLTLFELAREKMHDGSDAVAYARLFQEALRIKQRTQVLCVWQYGAQRFFEAAPATDAETAADVARHERSKERQVARGEIDGAAASESSTAGAGGLFYPGSVLLARSAVGADADSTLGDKREDAASRAGRIAVVNGLPLTALRGVIDLI